MDRSVDDWPLIGQLIPFYPWPLSKRSPTMSSCSLWPLFGDSWLWCSQGSVDTFMTVFLSWRSSTIAATWYSSRVDTVPCRFCLVTIAATWYISRVDTVPCRWEYFFPAHLPSFTTQPPGEAVSTWPTGSQSDRAPFWWPDLVLDSR